MKPSNRASTRLPGSARAGSCPPVFRRSRLSEALIAALLGLQAPAALAAVCTGGGQVTTPTGTGSGSLYQAFNTGCIELTWQLSGSQIELSQSFSSPNPYTIYADTVSGGPTGYGLGLSGTTLSTGGLVYDAAAVGGQNLALLELGSSWTPQGSGNTTVEPNTAIDVLRNANILNSVLLNDNYGTQYAPTIVFGDSLSFNHSITVYNSGALDTAQQSVSLLQNVYETGGSAQVLITGGGSLTLDGGSIETTGTMTINPLDDLVVRNATLSSPSQIMLNQGTLDVSQDLLAPQVSSLAGTGVVDLGANDLSISNGSSTFAGVIQGSGGLRITGGTQTLSGANTYAGGTSIASGAELALSGSGTIGAGAVSDDGTLDLSGSASGVSISSLSGGVSGLVLLGAQSLTLSAASSSFSGSIEGTGGLHITGGTQTLAGHDTYSGATSIASGATLALAGTGSLGSSTLSVDGVLDISRTTSGTSIASLSGGRGGVVQLGGQTLTLSKANSTFSGSIDGSGGLSIAAGTQVLTGASSYGGATSISSGATLTLAGSGSVAPPSVATDNGTLAFDNTHDTWGALIQGSGGVQVQGGSLTLTQADIYSGATSVSSGSTLYLSGAGSLANSAVGDEGVLDISATTSGASIASLSGSASGVVHLGGQTLTLSRAKGTFSGSIDGSGGLSIAAGTEVLAGASSYSGATSIASGATLEVAGTGSLGATTVNDDGTLEISGTTSGVSIASLSGSTGSVVDLGGKTLTLSAASSAFSGSISGSGGLTLSAGRQVLAGDNAYSGATSIAGGATLALAGSASLASSAVLDQGMLDVSNTTSGAALGTLAGNGAVNLGDRSLTLLAAASSFGGALAGSGTLIVAHGAETLTASNTLTGATVIDPGAAVALSGSGSLTSSPVQVNGLLDLSAASTGVSLPSLSGSGVVSLGTNDLVLTRATGQFTGRIQGSGTLRLLGGAQGLAGAQGYMGGTFVQQATLNLADGAQLASRLQVDSAGRVLVPAAASVAADASNSGTLSVGSAQSLGTLRVLGSYSQSASGTLIESVSPTAGSMLLVQGPQLSLGGRLLVQLLPGRFLRRTYVLVQAPSSTTLSGTFSALQVVGASANQYTYELRYVADPQVLLTVVQAAPFATGGSGSGSGQAQVGRVLDSVTATATGALYARLNALFDAPSLAHALDALDGQLYVQTPQWILQGTQHAWSRIFDRLDLGQQADAAPRQQAFVLVDGARRRLLGDARTDSVHQSASAMTLGRQLHVGAWELGAAAGTLTLGASRPRIGDGMTASLFRVGVFGARKLGSLRVGGVLGYTEGQVGYAMAQRQARVWTLQSRIGRDFLLPGGNVLTPLLSLDLQHLLLSGSTESDPLLGLRVAGQSVNTASSLAALRLVHGWHWRLLHGQWSVSLGVRHGWRRPPGSLGLSFDGIPAASFTTWGVPLPRNALEAALGLHARLRRHLSAQVAWQGDYGRGLRDNAIALRLVWRF